MTPEEMKQKAFGYIQEIETCVPAGHPWLTSLLEGEEKIRQGHEVTWGDLGNLALILAAVRILGGKSS